MISTVDDCSVLSATIESQFIPSSLAGHQWEDCSLDFLESSLVDRLLQGLQAILDIAAPGAAVVMASDAIGYVGAHFGFSSALLSV